MRLQYEIAVDDRQMRRSLRGIEGEVKASSRRTAREQTSGRQQDSHVRARERELSRIEREERRAADRSAKYWQDAHRRTADHRIREETRAERAREREARRAERVASRVAERTRGGLARSVVGSATGAMGTVARFGGAAVGVLGGIAIGEALSSQLAERKKASQLANQAGRPGMKGAIFDAMQNVRGFTGEEAGGGLGAFADVTGDMGTALAMLNDMGNVALATSTELQDLGSAMGTAFIPLADQIKDPTDRLLALKGVMRATAGMGAVGAVEVKDLASEMAGLAATSAKFAGGAARNLNVMVAFAEAARQRGGASSAAEAVTSAARFSSDLLTGPAQKKLRGLGVDVFTDKSQTQLRGADDILVDVLTKTKGNLVDLNAIFGERGVRAAAGFSPLFTQAEAANAKLAPGQRLKSGAAGSAAVRAELDRLLKASVNDLQIQERVESRMSHPDNQKKENLKNLKVAMGAELLPAITRAVPEFTKMIPAMASATSAVVKFAGFAADNPVQGIGAIIAAKVAADVGGGMIGKSLESGLANAIATSGGLKVAGGIAIAATSVLLAAQQYSELSTQTEGFGGIMAGLGSMLNGESFFKGVSDYQDQKALERFNDPFSQENTEKRLAALKSEGTGAGANYPAKPMPKGAPTLFADAVKSTQTPSGQTPPAGSFAEMLVAAKALQSAAGALVGAASKSGSALAPSAPARNGPINTRG